MERDTSTRHYRELWELGRRVTPALDALLSSVGGLFGEYGLHLDNDKTLRGIGAAAVDLADLIPSDFPLDFLFYGARETSMPRLLSELQEYVKELVIDLDASRARGYHYWKGSLDKLGSFQTELRDGFDQLRSVPQLKTEVYGDARQRFLQADDAGRQPGDFVEQPRASAAVDYQPGEPWGAEGFVDLPNGDVGICEATWPAQSGELTEAEKAELVEYAQASGIIRKQAEPATDAQPTEAAVEAMLAEAAARNEAMPPEDRSKLDALFGRALTVKEQTDLNALAIAFVAKHEVELKENPWAMTDRRLADGIHCSPSTASELPFWKEYKEKRGPKPSRGRRKSPRVTSYIEGTVGRPDEALERLKGEYEDDFEPSPLDDDPPGKPRRVKIEHREL